MFKDNKRQLNYLYVGIICLLAGAILFTVFKVKHFTDKPTSSKAPAPVDNYKKQEKGWGEVNNAKNTLQFGE
jgi:hypothetical protein